MLPMLAVKDARSGRYIKKGEVVRYPRTPGFPDEWWVWYHARNVGGPKGLQLWVRDPWHPAGYWQPVAPRWGGLVGLFPS